MTYKAALRSSLTFSISYASEQCISNIVFYLLFDVFQYVLIGTKIDHQTYKLLQQCIRELMIHIGSCLKKIPDISTICGQLQRVGEIQANIEHDDEKHVFGVSENVQNTP